MRIDPQVYYLRTDDRDGYYAYSGVTLAKAGLPLSISSLVNQPMRTERPRGRRLPLEREREVRDQVAAGRGFGGSGVRNHRTSEPPEPTISIRLPYTARDAGLPAARLAEAAFHAQRR